MSYHRFGICWAWTVLVAALFLGGCTHHRVTVSVEDPPGTVPLVHEEIRPRPVTIHHRYRIVLPDGPYHYDPHEYALQSNLPEKPVKTFTSAELVVTNVNGLGGLLDGGWLAIYRQHVEIRLLQGDKPASINGDYRLRVPVATPVESR